MKLVQKLEIAFGSATFVATLAYWCAIMLPFAEFKYENYGLSDGAIALFGSVLIHLVPSALTAIAAYFWAAKANRLAFGGVILGASITFFFDALLVAGVRFYSHDSMTTLLISIPLIFPILTVILAFSCRKVFLSMK